jgi:hypothetical protein
VRSEPRYALVTLAYLAAIHRLSSLPDLAAAAGDPAVLLAFNLSHAPLFGGLAFFMFKALPEGWSAWRARPAVAFGACAACAVLDEWHQSFVPGRQSSLGDLVLDLAGIAGILLVLRWHALRRERRPHAASPA